MYSAANLTALFAAAADMPHGNESEARMNNTTRAELFAGVLRAYRTSTAGAGIDTGKCSFWNCLLLSVVHQF